VKVDENVVEKVDKKGDETVDERWEQDVRKCEG
jgi:hypothetical protein